MVPETHVCSWIRDHFSSFLIHVHAHDAHLMLKKPKKQKAKKQKTEKQKTKKSKNQKTKKPKNQKNQKTKNQKT